MEISDKDIHTTLGSLILYLEKYGINLDDITNDDDNMYVMCHVPIRSYIKDENGIEIAADKCAGFIKNVCKKFFPNVVNSNGNKLEIKVIYSIVNSEWTMEKCKEYLNNLY